jgi:Zn-finger nucleic acid-binding protein
VDICKGHGTWFDRDELSRIVEFIRAGGLEESRTREKEDIKEERLKLLEQQRIEARRSLFTGRDVDDRRIPAIASAQGLLKLLLDN